MKHANWIIEVNLQPFLSELACLCGYEFDDDDWNAISYGLEGIDELKGDWYHYTLRGDTCVKVAITQEQGEAVYSVEVSADQVPEGAVETLFSVAQTYLICKP